MFKPERIWSTVWSWIRKTLLVNHKT